MPYVRKKGSTLRYLLQKLKNKAGHSKKRYYYCGIIDHDVIIQVPWLSKNKNCYTTPPYTHPPHIM